MFGNHPLLALLLCVCSLAPLMAAEGDSADSAPSVGVDRLMGNGGRTSHARRLAEFQIAGRGYSWEQYSAWGKELFQTGTIQRPPIGPAPSKPLSAFYRCTDCHNQRREDKSLTDQSPEARAALVQEQRTRKDKAPLFLSPGTTMWGAVNRESFYNGAFSLYHDLIVPGDRPMDPRNLSDAIQVCCMYCSIGRFAETWELYSLLTYFWDLEVRLVDLELPAEIEQLVLETLSDPDSAAPAKVAAMRKMIGRLYLRKAAGIGTPPPGKARGDSVGPYPDKLIFEGDKRAGELLYQSSCDHCHGSGKVNELAGPDLVRDLTRFHHVLAHGTARDQDPYMPMFTAERLSRQQIADIQAYLSSLE